ncbi:hypothetical protein [Microbacterium telephonicum]|uniref:Uncharacterized protein n=1 Tax=Microbacterium telephonicum TaxID=1714841 RepID=A0A498CLS3_9MICO|nr:hypothetical protein [Microbacterium telephonicum]RLK52758.1 hypothetical protein C7474_0715 [Microbacterium telephonicum]
MSTPHDPRRDDNADDAPLGGDETTEEQLDADNAAEEQMLKTLDPDNPAA